MPRTRRRDSAFAVIVRGSRVLLVRARGRRRWQLPGGGLKRDETPLAGLAREVDEETGLTPRVHALSGAYARADGSFALVYLASVGLRVTHHRPGHEIARLRWASPRKARRLLARRARERLADALACHAGQRRPAVRSVSTPAQHAQVVARMLRAASWS
ncbi:MAG: NUDIX hydrolase [Planctomycetia bacterium]